MMSLLTNPNDVVIYSFKYFKYLLVESLFYIKMKYLVEGLSVMLLVTVLLLKHCQSLPINFKSIGLSDMEITPE